MMAVKFSCPTIKELISISVYTGFVSHDKGIDPILQTSGAVFGGFETTVSFGNCENTEKALTLLEGLAEKERIGHCRVTI